MNYGVQQVSMIGLLFLIININDIELGKNSESNLILYADDSVLQTTARNSELTGRHHEA